MKIGRGGGLYAPGMIQKVGVGGGGLLAIL